MTRKLGLQLLQANLSLLPHKNKLALPSKFCSNKLIKAYTPPYPHASLKNLFLPPSKLATNNGIQPCPPLGPSPALHPRGPPAGQGRASRPSHSQAAACTWFRRPAKPPSRPRRATWPPRIRAAGSWKPSRKTAGAPQCGTSWRRCSAWRASLPGALERTCGSSPCPSSSRQSATCRPSPAGHTAASLLATMPVSPTVC